MFRQLFVATVLIGLAWSGTAQAQSPTATPAIIQWTQSPAQAFADAKATNRPVVVFIATEWCHYCKVMQAETWNHGEIAKAVGQGFVALQLDGDRDHSIVDQLHLSGYPATFVYTPDGRLIAKKEGMMAAGQAYQWLADSYRSVQDAARTAAAAQIANR